MEVTALTNGNYVVGSPFWRNAARDFVGAATWANGTTGITGYLSSTNSLVGVRNLDNVGHTVALTNGNYVVVSPNWNDIYSTNAGAVTFGDGRLGINGYVSGLNSLIGMVTNDKVGGGGVFPLDNGNYVVCSPSWNFGSDSAAGAVTWGAGFTGAFVSTSNSIFGSSKGDMIGSDGIQALVGGNYLIRSSHWDKDTLVDAGAITWADGSMASHQPVSAVNSLVGSRSGEFLGAAPALALSNGNYVVAATNWVNSNGAKGAVCWRNGNMGLSGTIDPTNSVTGSKAGDVVGTNLYGLSNGNFVVESRLSPGNVSAPYTGASTWGNGQSGLKGTIDSLNSFMCPVTPDSNNVTPVFRAFSNGDYAIGNPSQATFAKDGGAFSYGDGNLGLTGTAKNCNTIFGTTAKAGLGMNAIFSTPYDYMLVGIPAENSVRIFKASNEALAINHDTATHGLSASANSPTPFIYGGGCRLITAIRPNGAAALTGATTTVALLQDLAPSFFNITYVRRHVDIQSATASDKATSRITFYFEQSDFTDYNNSIKGAATSLPSSPTDARGKANLKIIQAYGTSSTGLLGTYTTTNPQRFNIIDPDDADVIWNTRSMRWEVTVDVTGLGGFFAYGESSSTGILGIASKSNVEVSPIPATSELNLHVRNAQLIGQMASVTDIQGRQVRQFVLKAQMSVDVRDLAPGVYFLRLPDATVVKIAKQ